MISVHDKFWSKVTKTNGCWIWEGGCTKQGYGNFSINPERSMLAHRFSYKELVGPIPAGHDIHHTCKNKKCVNPEHLTAIPHSGHPRKEQCKRGHPLRGSNIRLRREGHRTWKVCLACLKLWREKKESQKLSSPSSAHRVQGS